jgi:Ca-activated chloride channel family protein
MKVRSVSVLAAAGMMLTSLTVWSLTPKGASVEPEPGPIATIAGPIQPGPDHSRFTVGRTLMMEGRLGNARLVAGQDNQTFVSVSVKAGADSVASTPSPLELSIVIDRSGSMKGKRLDNAVAAAQGMIRRLRDGDVVSVIAYNTQTETLVPSTTIDASSRERAIAAISGLVARGDTCISCGIDAGMDMLRKRGGMVERMLLLSDGEATAGVRDVEGFRRIASTVRHLGAAISTIGVDVDYNERVMTALAQESNGEHYFVENPSALSAVFDKELQSLVHTVTKDTNLTIALAPGVEVEQVFDRSFQRDGDRIVVPMGSFAAGDTKTLLVRVHVPRGAAGQRAIADVKLDYDDLDARSPGSCRGSLAALLVSDPSDASPVDPLVQGRVERSETASTLREANHLFATGNAGEAKRKLATRLDALRHQRAVAEKSAPKPRKKEVAADFEHQANVLGKAEQGFEAPAAAAPAGGPAQTHAGKAQVRQNAADAFDLGR